MTKGDGNGDPLAEAALDAVAEFVAVFSADGTPVRWNERVPTVSGCGEAVESLTFRDFFADDARERVDEEFEAVLDHRSNRTFEAPLVTHSGDRLPYEFSLTPMTTNDDESSPKVVAVGRDVGDRAEYREELRKKRNLLEQIFEQVPINLYVKDREGRHLWMSNTHRDPDGVIGKTDREFYEGEFGEETYADDMRVIETGEPIYNKEENNPEQDIWTLTSKVPWYGEDGRIRGLIGVTRDISERKEYKQELNRQNERLERFANVVSHDLRNPLNIASGYLDVAAEECDSEYLDRVDVALGRMEEIVTGVLTMVREDQTVEEAEPMELSDLAEQSWRNVDTGAADLEIDGSVAFEGDPVRVHHVLENLFRNAVEHGGDDVTVRVGPLERGWYVEDTGPGIPEEERDTVFELGHSSRPDGTGLGLNIVEQLVTAHGWSIRATDGDGGGARFEITDVEVGES